VVTGSVPPTHDPAVSAHVGAGRWAPILFPKELQIPFSWNLSRLTKQARYGHKNNANGHCGQAHHAPLIPAQSGKKRQEVFDTRRGQRKRQPLQYQDQPKG
jgi:hypothetical protein